MACTLSIVTTDDVRLLYCCARSNTSDNSSRTNNTDSDTSGDGDGCTHARSTHAARTHESRHTDTSYTHTLPRRASTAHASRVRAHTNMPGTIALSRSAVNVLGTRRSVLLIWSMRIQDAPWCWYRLAACIETMHKLSAKSLLRSALFCNSE